MPGARAIARAIARARRLRKKESLLSIR